MIKVKISTNRGIDNDEKAIKKARSYGVDVNSGCENNNVIKDKEKVKRFVENTKKIKI